MMLSFFRSRRTAPVARDRLKVLLAHERAFVGKPDLIGLLRDEILAVIRKHIPVDPDRVRVTAERADKVSTLTVDIEIPMDLPTAAAA
jgi:cell division topological specificity factor